MKADRPDGASVVEAASSGAAKGSLAFTGTTVGLTALIGLVLVALGSVALKMRGLV